ncbi:hypothetical protein [Clostridium sp.]|uniref:hypothetical protein n=1 Tax=Clostridium sp. TaxID=1506 RepID=UPI0039965B2E
MTRDRLRIILEFNPKNPEDLKLYNVLIKYSKPSFYVKDCIRGLLELPVEYRNVKEKKDVL